MKQKLKVPSSLWSIINSHHVQLAEHEPSDHSNPDLRDPALKLIMMCSGVETGNWDSIQAHISNIKSQSECHCGERLIKLWLYGSTLRWGKIERTWLFREESSRQLWRWKSDFTIELSNLGRVRQVEVFMGKKPQGYLPVMKGRQEKGIWRK